MHDAELTHWQAPTLALLLPFCRFTPSSDEEDVRNPASRVKGSSYAHAVAPLPALAPACSASTAPPAGIR